MEYTIGVVLGLVTGFAGRFVGFDRDRAFYPVVLIVVASYYALFATMDGSTAILIIEVGQGLVFAAVAVIGFRSNLWLVVAGLAAHGIFDFFVHDRLVMNPGMPLWWPGFCGAIDICLAAFFAWVLSGDRLRATADGQLAARQL
jgi:hypothetical protein